MWRPCVPTGVGEICRDDTQLCPSRWESTARHHRLCTRWSFSSLTFLYSNNPKCRQAKLLFKAGCCPAQLWHTADSAAGVDVPVCVPTGAWKQSRSAARRAVCSPNPICSPMAGLPPDHVFKLSTALRAIASAGLSESREQPPSGDRAGSGYCVPDNGNIDSQNH